jgi:hypothetical protein
MPLTMARDETKDRIIMASLKRHRRATRTDSRGRMILLFCKILLLLCFLLSSADFTASPGRGVQPKETNAIAKGLMITSVISQRMNVRVT